MSEEEQESPKGFPVKPETLMLTGLGLSVVLVILLTTRLRRLEQAVAVVNGRKPCGCQETGQETAAKEGVSQNGTTGLDTAASPSGSATTGVSDPTGL